MKNEALDLVSLEEPSPGVVLRQRRDRRGQSQGPFIPGEPKSSAEDFGFTIDGAVREPDDTLASHDADATFSLDDVFPNEVRRHLHGAAEAEEVAHRFHVIPRLAEPLDAALNVISIKSVEKLFDSHALLTWPLKTCRTDSVVSDLSESLLQELSSLLFVAGSGTLPDFYDSAVDRTPVRDVPDREVLPVLSLPPEDPPVTAHGPLPSPNSPCFQCVRASWPSLGVMPFHYSSGSAHPAPDLRF